tara:strand:+ start:796 stop:2154 length:1359 start_codon:yes stop_codon:yes gene_type:complete
MGGGLIQLVTIGAQDVYLTGNPQVTFFKVVYRRYTNFSKELIQQTIEGQIGDERQIQCKIKRDGDLIHRIYLEYENNDPFHYPSNFGNFMFNEINLLIGGQVIDTHTGHWMEVYSRLIYNQQNDQQPIETKMNKKNYSGYQKNSCAGGVIGTTDNPVTLGKISIPLQFWFCRNPGLALPLIALQYNEVILQVNFNSLKHIYKSNKENPIHSDNNINFEIWVEYIYLDTDERRRFAQVSHEYLIEKIQYVEKPLESGNNIINLNFNNLIKELIFSCDWNNFKNLKDKSTDYSSYGSIPGLGNNNTKVSIQANSQNIFNPDRTLNYFTRNQILENHKNFPMIHGNNTHDGIIYYMSNEKKMTNYISTNGPNTEEKFDIIGVHSFCLNPEDHQPTGSFNFSMASDCKLTLKEMCPPKIKPTTKITYYTESRKLIVYANSYNILRIMSGMGKLAYI